jgi:hypothetical protein
MIYEPQYAFEHAPSGTLVRRVHGGNKIELSREGRSIARVDVHLNEPVSMAPNGLIGIDPGIGGIHVLDVKARQPSEPKQIFEDEMKPEATHEIVHPDGKQIVGWRYSNGDEPDELVYYPLTGGRGKAQWSGSTKTPRKVNPFKVGEPGAQRNEDRIGFPLVAIAPDGDHWAAIAANRMELGKGTHRTASLFWGENEFFPVRHAFDLEHRRGRLLLSGAKGVSAFDFDGSVVATWRSSDDSPACSPAVRYGDDLLVVVQLPGGSYGQPKEHQVVRLDPETLKHRGTLDAFGRFRSEAGGFVLLPLADGSLALCPFDAPITILPSSTAKRTATPLVQVLGQAKDIALPEPTDDPEYDAELGRDGNLNGRRLHQLTPAQRRSFARFLLEELQDDTNFNQLVEFDVDAFAPYRDAVLGWSDDRLSQFDAMSFRSFWRSVRGASDKAVDGVVQRLKKATGEQRDRLVLLLLGVDTPHSLEALGSLGRKSKEIKALAHRESVLVPKQGSAIRRFSPEVAVVIAGKVSKAGGEARPAKGVSYLNDAKRLLSPTALTCKAAPFNVLSVNLDVLPGNPLKRSKMRTQQFFMSGCEDCDEWGLNFAFRRSRSGNKLALSLLEEEPDDGDEDEAEEMCSGSVSRPKKARKLWMAKAMPYGVHKDQLGRIGGRPDWVQSPQPPDCPECGQLMFFVGQANGYDVLGNLPAGTLFGFHCEDCSVAVQLIQST